MSTLKSESPALAVSPAAPTRIRGQLGTYLGLSGVLVGMVLLFGWMSEYFLSVDTFVAIANEIPALMVMAIGMTFVLIIAGIDLSVGSVLALSAAISATQASRRACVT